MLCAALALCICQFCVVFARIPLIECGYVFCNPFSGLDIPKHGEPAYPAEAWGDGWGNFLHVSGAGLGKNRSNQLLAQKLIRY